MTGRLAMVVGLALAAPVIAAFAAIVSAQEGGGGANVVQGDMISCPDGRQVQSSFRMEGSNWSVTGILTAGLATNITVAGPSGDVTVIPTVNLVVTGNPQIGEPASMQGVVAETGEMVATSIHNPCAEAAATPVPPEAAPADAAPPAIIQTDEDEARGGDDEDDGGGVCNRGSGRSGDSRMLVNDGGVHIQRGAVLSADGETLTVAVPDGSVTVVITEDTHLNGDLAGALEVKVRGEFDDGGQLIADEVKALCPHDGSDSGSSITTGDDDDDDGGGDDDDDDGGGEGDGDD